MFKLVVLCASLAYVASNPLGTGRIVNGTNAQYGEIPYIVSLRNNGGHSCGGSILDATNILTAAHCVDGKDLTSFSVQYGVTDIESDENEIPVTAIYVHENYNRTNNHINDIAVLKLEASIQFGQQAQPALLPRQDEAPLGGQWGVLAGWGYEKSGGIVQMDLQRVDIVVYTDEACKAAHGKKVDARYNVCSGIPEGGKGQCSGDSGGPLYDAGGKQVGVVSWSVKPCAVKGKPGVFARVSSYIDWINQKMRL